MACNSDDPLMEIVTDETLFDLVAENVIAQDSVIACASGSMDQDEFIVYLYPRPGVTDIRYFETENVLVDENDYQNYNQVLLTQDDFFDGYLRSFTRQSQDEKWVIITFMENDILNLSAPIRVKHLTQNTLFTSDISIDQSQSGMPFFSWNALVDPLDVIYFQVVSDSSDQLLSGTYTFESEFRYYDLANVVLNITRDTPPELIDGQTYGYTLMGVSEDNWVNTLAQTTFTVSF